jgi:chitinase
LTFTATKTLKAKGFKSGMTESDVASGTYTITQQQVATPTFNPAPGSYTGSVTVSILCATNGATIRYTTNGSDPTSSSTVYSSPLTFTATTTLKTKGFKSGMTESEVAIGIYTIAVTPYISSVSPNPVPGLNGNQNFTINVKEWGLACDIAII